MRAYLLAAAAAVVAGFFSTESGQLEELAPKAGVHVGAGVCVWSTMAAVTIYKKGGLNHGINQKRMIQVVEEPSGLMLTTWDKSAPAKDSAVRIDEISSGFSPAQAILDGKLSVTAKRTRKDGAKVAAPRPVVTFEFSKVSGLTLSASQKDKAAKEWALFVCGLYEAIRSGRTFWDHAPECDAVLSAVVGLKYDTVTGCRTPPAAHVNPTGPITPKWQDYRDKMVPAKKALFEVPDLDRTATPHVVKGYTSSRQAAVQFHLIGVPASDSRVAAAKHTIALMLDAFPSYPKVFDIVITDKRGVAVAYVWPIDKDVADGTKKPKADEPMQAYVFLASPITRYTKISARNFQDNDVRGGVRTEDNGAVTVGDLVRDAYAKDSGVAVHAVKMGIETNVMHELCHVLHQVVNPDTYWLLTESKVTPIQALTVRRGAGHYSNLKEQGGMNEFIAEYCAGTMQGLPFPQSVTDLYAAVGGPAIPSSMKAASPPHGAVSGTKFWAGASAPLAECRGCVNHV